MNLRPSIALFAALALTACGGASPTEDASAGELRHRHRDGGVVHRDGGTPGTDGGVPPGRGCVTSND